ncbi:hypothetical protein [Eikenella sp. Marseille-P7795]|nr:hypothetical protein [Eikenella sp. Marseille-P7795]
MSNANLEFADRMAKILDIFNGNVSELARQAGIAPLPRNDGLMANLIRK